MTAILLAQVAAGSWSLVQILVAIVIIAAVLAVVVVALNYFGIEFPPVILRIIGIVVVAAIAIVGIRFLLSL